MLIKIFIAGGFLIVILLVKLVIYVPIALVATIIALPFLIPAEIGHRWEGWKKKKNTQV